MENNNGRYTVQRLDGERSEELTRIRAGKGHINGDDLPPPATVGMPVKRKKRVILYEGAQQPDPVTESSVTQPETHAPEPSGDDTVFMQPPTTGEATQHVVPPATDAATYTSPVAANESWFVNDSADIPEAEIVQGEVADPVEADMVGGIWKGQENDVQDADIVDDEPKKSRAGRLVLAAAVLAVAGTTVAYYEMNHDKGLTAKDISGATANAPAAHSSPSVGPLKQHRKPHHKPAPSAIPSVEVKPTKPKPTHTPATNVAPTEAPTTDTLPAPITAPIPTGPTDLRIGSLDLDTSKGDKDWQEDLAKSFAVASKNLDVIAFRGIHANQWHRSQADDMFNKTHYAVYPDKYNDFAAHESIYVNTDVLDVVSSMTLSGTHGPDVQTHPNAVTAVRLRNKETGQEFYVLNTTLPDGKTVEAYKARTDAATTLVDYAANLESSEKVPVFILADMSDKGARHQDQNGNFVVPQYINEPYCTMTGIGKLTNAFVLAHAVTGVTARDCSRDPKMPADQLYMTGSGVELVDYSTTIGPKRNGTQNSDLLTATVKMTGEYDFTTAVTGAS